MSETLREIARRAAKTVWRKAWNGEDWESVFNRVADAVAVAVLDRLIFNMPTHTAPLDCGVGIRWSLNYLTRQLAEFGKPATGHPATPPSLGSVPSEAKKKHASHCDLFDWDGRSNDPKPICTCRASVEEKKLDMPWRQQKNALIERMADAGLTNVKDIELVDALISSVRLGEET